MVIATWDPMSDRIRCAYYSAVMEDSARPIQCKSMEQKNRIVGSVSHLTYVELRMENRICVLALMHWHRIS